MRENSIFSPNLSPALITQIITNNGKQSQQIKDIKTADDYYQNKNSIEDKTRDYYDKDRNRHENPTASNAKLGSNFLRMLVQQKQDYGFAKSFILNLSTEEESEVSLDDTEYGKQWKKFCKDVLYKMAHILASQAVNHGIAWAYVWIDEEGELNITDTPSDCVFPVWIDIQHKELDRLVYNYTQKTYDSLNPKITEYSDYWDNNNAIKFNVSENYTPIGTADKEGNLETSHMSGGVSWGKIPFVALKSTDDEKPLLNFIKNYIDAYDLLNSKSVDGLIDDLDPLLVFKGISPDVSGLIEAREIAKMTRTMSLDTDGDAYYIQAQTPIDSHQTKMESLRRDIIKFGYGIDYEDSRFSGNPNQLVIKSLYQNLDTYTDGLERQFQNFIDNLKYFFDKWCDWTGKVPLSESEKYNVLIKLDRSMMVNQSAQIEDVVKLSGTGVSQKTLLEFNPVVQDVDMELERLEEEKEKETDIFDFPEKEEPVEEEETEEEQGEEN